MASSMAFEGCRLRYFFSRSAIRWAALSTVWVTFSSLSLMISFTQGCALTMRSTFFLSPSKRMSRSEARRRLSLWRFESAAQGSFFS